MPALVGTPSDNVPDILATGRTDITTIYVSMSACHPEGRDAEYLEWRSMDHRPEQHRLASLRASLRIVSSPACRAARAASDARYDHVDHVMTSLSTDVAGLEEFGVLSEALGGAGRKPYLLPMVERWVYHLDGTVAAPRIKAGDDVLPWWPARGMYVLVEHGEASPSELVEVPGVAGAWRGVGIPMGAPYASAENRGLQITYCYLDDDPVATAERLRPALAKRWTDTGVVPLLAVPFHTIGPYEWSRYVP